MSLEDLLARGYFPKELPNPFVTDTFAKLIASQQFSLPGELGPIIPTNSRNFPKIKPSKHSRYSHARGGRLRRLLSIPNPIHFAQLCMEIIQNWASLAPLVSGSKFSATAPVFFPKGRALQGKHLQNRPALARQTRLNNRYILQTDISRFYQSTYTHSIPWAIHSKLVAKKERSPQHLGNRLDYWTRIAQDQQTVGIPIGPDTSLLLAELLMHRCDEKLAYKNPGVKGHRFIDDYELGFRDRSAAEDAFHILENCLGDFELALNASKTKVRELPYPLESPNINLLRNFTFRAKSREEAADIQFYFDKLFELHCAFPDDHIINYGVGRVANQKTNSDNWQLLESLLLLCIAPEPACLLYALKVIIGRYNEGQSINLDGLETALNTLIVEHAPLGHSSEVAWALWGCLALNLPIHSKAVATLQTCEDSVIALLSLDCEQKGLMKSPLDKTLWESWMTAEGLYDEHWLLVYEANVKGWLQKLRSKDIVKADKNFGFLKAHGVSFYAPPLPKTKSGGKEPAPMPNTPAASLTQFQDVEIAEYFELTTI